MPLFGREFIIDVGLPGKVGKRFKGLDMKAAITMKAGQDPNEGRVTITNPAPATIDILRQPGVLVRVLAGYDEPLLVFQGDPVEGGVEIKREKTDRIAVIEAQDGGRGYRLGRVNISFSKAIPITQAFEEAVNSMGLAVGQVALDPRQRIPAGFTMYGPARKELDRFAQMAGGDWTIRDGLVSIIRAGQTSGERAIVFSATNGNLIGSPKLADEGEVEVKALLEPSMRPYKPFRVVSDQITGFFRAEEVKFDITSRRNENYVIIKGSPL